MSVTVVAGGVALTHVGGAPAHVGGAPAHRRSDT
jgi:hypothetical protein